MAIAIGSVTQDAQKVGQATVKILRLPGHSYRYDHVSSCAQHLIQFNTCLITQSRDNDQVCKVT